MSAGSPEEIHALMAAAFDAGDLDAFAELHEEGATARVPPDGRLVSGRDAIAAAAAPVLAHISRFDVEVLDTLQAGDLALTQTRWRAIGTGAQPELSGRGTIVSRRQPDGSWRIVLDNPASPH